MLRRLRATKKDANAATSDFGLDDGALKKFLGSIQSWIKFVIRINRFFNCKKVLLYALCNRFSDTPISIVHDVEPSTAFSANFSEAQKYR